MIRRILKSEGFTIFLILLGLVLVIVSLTACGAPSKGTVKEKDYDPGYSYWQAGYTTCSGTPSRCTTTPGYYVYVPESYDLLIADYEVEGWVEVSQRTYDSTNIGDYYDNGTITAGH